MTIHEPGIYHIYNRGNNQQAIFFNQENYFYFLRKCHKYLKPVSEILAWCLMPNHFHFLLEVTDKSLLPVKVGNIDIPSVTNGFRLLQSSYTKGINKQLNRTGNLFQQKTKAKLTSAKENYATIAFHYIHQNPFAAGLVTTPEKWVYSSLQDYAGFRKGTLCNRDKAFQLLDLTEIDFKAKAFEKIDEEIIKEIF
jgi:REP element-mobilizing transposase RayT